MKILPTSKEYYDYMISPKITKFLKEKYIQDNEDLDC